MVQESLTSTFQCIEAVQNRFQGCLLLCLSSTMSVEMLRLETDCHLRKLIAISKYLDSEGPEHAVQDVLS